MDKRHSIFTPFTATTIWRNGELNRTELILFEARAEEINLLTLGGCLKTDKSSAKGKYLPRMTIEITKLKANFCRDLE